MTPPERGGPQDPDEPSQDDRPADQDPKNDTTRKGGRHRREPRRWRLTAQQAAELVKCAPAIIRLADEAGKHEAPIRELIHTLTGAAQQVLDVISNLFT